jgi:hypothetical protein
MKIALRFSTRGFLSQKTEKDNKKGDLKGYESNKVV